MNWEKAKIAAKEVFDQSPTRIGGFSIIPDKKQDIVLISCYDEKVVVAIHNRTDIIRLRATCDLALKKNPLT